MMVAIGEDVGGGCSGWWVVAWRVVSRTHALDIFRQCRDVSTALLGNTRDHEHHLVPAICLFVFICKCVDKCDAPTHKTIVK
jgi:hypothetical protein